MSKSISTVYTIVTSLVTKLLEADKRRQNDSLIEINAANKSLQKQSIDGFIYRGDFWCPTLDGPILGGARVKRTLLHPTLEPKMNDWLSERNLIVHEQHLIRQVLHTLVRKCQDMQDLRDTLPECVVMLFKELDQLSRTREPAWTIQDNPRALSQWAKVLPRIEVCAMSRMVF